MLKKPILSIVMSNFNTRSILKNTLNALQKRLIEIPSEIIVIDDASSDNSADMVRAEFPNVRLLVNKKNIGYSKSYNRGTKVAHGRYILHLNSDVTIPERSSFSELLTYMDKHPEVGVLGCKLIKPNGRLDLPCRRSFPTIVNVLYQTLGLATLFPKNKYFGNYYLTYLPENKIAEVDCLMGAFMLIRKRVVDEVGLLDEQFFIYGEDIDYCYRVKKNGYKIVYFPPFVAHHMHNATLSTLKYKNIVLFHSAMYKYYKKHFGTTRSQLINAMVYCGITVRLIALVCVYFMVRGGIRMKKLSLVSNKRRAAVSGFTLIELMLVMAIIAILAALITGNFFTALKKGRDARRKSDLEQVQRAVEIYYEDKKAYPLPGAVLWSSSLTDATTGKIYMQKLPADPSIAYSYQYMSDGTYYRLYACIENSEDKGAGVSQGGYDSGSGTAIACGTCTCKYTIASSNITPIPTIAVP